ncbi:MAG: CO dehydrogenase/acetyl-CoA synthase complex subunit epsilon, partial [Methanosarcinaceae archaeon]|nr:CO dehydrogenase/acetyl-CoA synthase complex subunit epsilon [Methanosarcinaceae archaeon]
MVDTTKNTRIYTTWGTKTAKPVQPKTVAKLITKAKRPLLVVGSLVLDEEILSRAVS